MEGVTLMLTINVVSTADREMTVMESIIQLWFSSLKFTASEKTTTEGITLLRIVILHLMAPTVEKQ